MTPTLNSLKPVVRPIARSAIRAFHSSPRTRAIYPQANTQIVNKVIEASSQGRVVLVDFYADWCQPCRLFSPILEKFAAEPNTSANGVPVDLVKVDTESDEGQSLAVKHKVRALPTVYVYKDGEAVTHFEGALPEVRLQQLLDSL